MGAFVQVTAVTIEPLSTGDKAETRFVIIKYSMGRVVKSAAELPKICRKILRRYLS